MKIPGSNHIAYCVTSIDAIKHAALFYDSVVPFPLEAVASKAAPAVSSVQVVQEIRECLPGSLFEHLLGPVGSVVLKPDEFGMAGHRFRALFLMQLLVMHEFSRQIAHGAVPAKCGIPAALEIAESGFEPVLMMPEAALRNESAEADDVTIALRNANLIDATNASWDQIVELRRNREAQRKLRNLRLFFQTHYAGKARAYVEDDLAKRLEDYDNVVKDYGFETLCSTITLVANSKSMVSFGTAGLAAILFGQPAFAAAAFGTGASLELAKISIEVATKRHAFNKLRRDYELAYIIDIREETKTTPAFTQGGKA